MHYGKIQIYRWPVECPRRQRNIRSGDSSFDLSLIHILLGAAIMGVLRNGLVLLSVSAYWQQAVLGIVIILAVTFDKLRSSKR